jgi:hypothetical protein
MRVRLIDPADPGMNLAILNADGISAQSAEFQVVKATYQLKNINILERQRRVWTETG